jgi:hypothetical protein
VFDLLREFHEADKSAGFRFDSLGIDEMEQVLLERKEALIDLALARYGRSAKVVSALFRKSANESGDSDVVKGVRLGCLANSMEPVSYFSAPSGLRMEELEAIVLGDSGEEAQELLKNPAAGHLLAKLYSRRPPFDTVPDERFVKWVRITSGNPRIGIDDSNEYGADLLAHDIQRGILNLVLTVPIHGQWLGVLHALLMRLDPRTARTPSEAEAREAVSRWAALAMKEPKNESDEAGYYAGVSLEEFRCLVAAIYGRWFDPEMKAFGILGDATSDDVALRCSFYGNAPAKQLTPKVVEDAVSRDSNLFAFAALWNDNVLMDRGLRATLESCLQTDLEWVYAKRCEQNARHYRWFDPRPVSEHIDTPEAPTHTFASLAADIAKLEAKVVAAATSVTKTAAPTWFYWAVVALLIYIAFGR